MEENNLRNEWCFGCGRKNPIGLKLEFKEIDGDYQTTFTAGPEHQGYDGIVHGGIVSTVLDEVMARYIYSKGLNAVTARLEVRYIQPTPVGVALTVRSRVERHRGPVYELTGSVQLPDGTVTAQGAAKVFVTNGK